MLVDDVVVRLKAGDGGAGAVAFNKIRLALGPTGGNGGKGGSIYFEGVANAGALSYFSNRKEINAENGGNGRGQFIDGRAGTDLILKIPTGTRITNTETGHVEEISQAGERLLAVEGGAGGRGNFKFRSSTNTSPREFEEGKPGQSGRYRLELRLIADIGLIGLPNAGKSSLLNALTAAKSRIGNYAFTTLEPHLGAYHELIIADIPGLIEGASEGRGLGVQFLKHIERTKILFHLVSAESEAPVRDYQIVRNELETYNPELCRKKEFVFLTKSDAVSEGRLQQEMSELKGAGISAVPVSLLDGASIEDVKHILNDIKSPRA